MASGKRATAAVSDQSIEGPWGLPDGWRWERLGDLVDRSPAKHTPDTQSGLSFIGLEHIPSHQMRVTGATPYREMKSAASAFKKGDILYGRLRPYLNKVWVADRDGACSGELLVLRPTAAEARFLAFCIHGSRFVNYVSHVTTGDRPRIDFAQIALFQVPVPPISTQRQIVARIDALFAEIDEGERALAEARAGVETYRKALLKAAVTGELTADWRARNPPKETGQDLLHRILTDRRARWEANPRNKGKRYVEPKTAYNAEDLGRTPDASQDGWCSVKLGWITECLDFMRVPLNRNVRSQRNGDVPYYGANGQVGWVDAHIFDETLVLVVEDETFTGREKDFSYIIKGKSWVNNHAHVLRAGPFISSEYLNLILARYPFIPMTTGTTGRKKLTQAALVGAPISVPPVAEQSEAMGHLSTQLAAVRELSKEASELVCVMSSLRQSILAAAFRGELVA